MPHHLATGPAGYTLPRMLNVTIGDSWVCCQVPVERCADIIESMGAEFP
jgi:hypothetical protein